MLIEIEEIVRALRLHLSIPKQQATDILRVLGTQLQDVLERLQADGATQEEQLDALLAFIDQMAPARHLPQKDQTMTHQNVTPTTQITLTTLNQEGLPETTFTMNTPQAVVGKEGDFAFPEDSYLDESHARFAWSDQTNQLTLEDLQSANGTFVQIKEETPLHDGDTFLMGRHVMRLSKHTSEGDVVMHQDKEVRLMGSPQFYQWRLIRLGVHEEALAIHPLPEDRPVVMGREPQLEDEEEATLIAFSEDKFMSSRQAKMTFHDGQWRLQDTNSSNGIWLGVTETKPLQDGDRVFLGVQLLEVAIQPLRQESDLSEVTELP